MSRRSRRRTSSGGGNKLGIIAVILMVILVVGVGVVHTMIRKYLHSDEFRQMLSSKVNEAAKVDGKFAPFRWDGLAVDTDSYQATSDGLIRELNVEGLHTEIGLGEIWSGIWQIQGSRVRKIEVVLDTRAPKAPPKAVIIDESTMRPETKKKSWMPSEFEVEQVDIGGVEMKVLLKKGEVIVNNVRAQVDQAAGGQAFDIHLEGGEIALPTQLVSKLRLREASMRYQNEELFLNDFDARVWENGHLLSAGEWDFKNKRYAFQGSLEGVRMDELVSDSWAKKVSGVVATSYTVLDRGTGPQANGRVVVRDGVLTALPVLDTLAAYADTRRFRMLNLNEASADWQWRKNEIRLTNLILSSEGLVRLEGDLAIRGENLDGDFRLGLAPGTLASIPGAETQVFLPGEHGLLWAPMKITGTISNPQEDLKSRLIAAAGMRIFTIIPETGEKALKFSGRVIKEAPGKVIEGGTKVIQGGVKVIEGGVGIVGDAGSLLGDLLGGGSNEDEDEDKDSE